MQTKEDIAEKYARALNDLRKAQRSRDHWRNEAQYHIWRGRARGRQIYVDRMRFQRKLWERTRPWWWRMFGSRSPVPA